MAPKALLKICIGTFIGKEGIWTLLKFLEVNGRGLFLANNAGNLQDYLFIYWAVLKEFDVFVGLFCE